MENNLSSIENHLSSISNAESEYCRKSKQYWENVSPTVSGMLGGCTSVHNDDVRESNRLLRNIFKKLSLNNLKTPLRALDCGSGIGRVTKFVLSKHFDEIDLLDRSVKFMAKAKEYLNEDYGKIRNEFVQSMQEFEPLQDRYYHCVWSQWVIGYLTDEDLKIFLSKCSKIIDPDHGFIVIKDNVAKTDKFILDESDGFVTRSEKKFKEIFNQVDSLEVKFIYEQKRLPKSLLPVKMFVLKHKKSPCSS